MRLKRSPTTSFRTSIFPRKQSRDRRQRYAAFTIWLLTASRGRALKGRLFDQ